MPERRFHNGSEKITIKEALQHSARGMNILRKLQPGDMELRCLSGALGALSPLLVLFFSSKIITELSEGRDVAKIALYAGLTVGMAFLFRIATSLIGHINTARGSNYFWQRLQLLYGCQYAEMDYVYVEDGAVNELLADINAKQNANGLGLHRLNYFFPDFFGRIIGLIGAGTLLFGLFASNGDGSFINSPWVLVLLLLASIVIPAAAQLLMVSRLNSLIQYLFTNLAKSNTINRYYLHNFIYNQNSGKDVRIFDLKNSILDALNKSSSWYRGAWKRAGCENNGLTAAVGIAFTVLAYWVIGLRALSGLYGIGEVARYVGAIGAFTGSMVGIINNLSFLYKNASYLPMLYDFLDLPTQKYLGSLTTEKRTDNEYELKFHHVSFKYPGSDTYALKNLNLKLNIGKKLAVVGRNGSGKTTMIKLLCRLYDPTEGMITLNGVDIKKYIYDDYIKIFSVVFQDFALLHFPLGQNVAADSEYDAEAIKAALEKTGFGTRLAELEKGLETPLYKGYDNEGVMVSGGEAQKIALARALYKNAPFVILDEPTAALDPLAEYEIYSKFDNLVGGKTAVYISHRLSSCRFCDDIAVFRDGELVQRGSHEALVTDEQGEYFNLWTAQAQHYAAQDENDAERITPFAIRGAHQ